MKYLEFMSFALCLNASNHDRYQSLLSLLNKQSHFLLSSIFYMSDSTKASRKSFSKKFAELGKSRKKAFM